MACGGLWWSLSDNTGEWSRCRDFGVSRVAEMFMTKNGSLRSLEAENSAVIVAAIMMR